MHCPRCGAALGEAAWRCERCRKTTPALGLALVHALLLLGSLAAWWAYRNGFVRTLTEMNGGLGMELPVPMRLHLWLSDWLMLYGALPLLLLVGLLALARNPRMPVFVRSGGALALCSALVALWVLAGLLFGYIAVLAPVVKLQ